MLRTAPKFVAILTLIGDAFKGWVVVYLCFHLTLTSNLHSLAATAGFFAFLGHLYPLFFDFKGGKGVATALGVILALSPIATVWAVGVWMLILLVFRYVSLASILGAITAGIAVGLISPYPIEQGTVWVIVLLLIWRHRPNIQKLILGQENKLFSKPKLNSGEK